MKKLFSIFLMVLSVAIYTSCGEDGVDGLNGQDGADGAPGTDGQDGTDGAQGEQGPPGMDAMIAEVDIDTVQFTSITPPLVLAGSGAPAGMEITPLFSSEDVLPVTPDFTFGGSADGAGFLEVDGQFEYFVNNEDNYAVAKVIFNSSMTPVAGEYVLNSSGAGTRLCSGSLIEPDIHGFGPLFLTAGESGIESQIHSIDVNTAEGSSAGIPRPVVALGRWNSENAVALPQDTYNDTNIIIGDDHSGGAYGQIVMYRDSGVGDLVGGSVYVLRRTNLDRNELNMAEGETVDVEFVEIPNARTLSGDQLDQAAEDSSAIGFGRVEDVDFRKGTDLGTSGREIWFAVTGTQNDLDMYSESGRVYRLNLSEGSAFSGTLTCVIDGDTDGLGFEFHNPDNIMVTTNFVYIQEDPNGYNRGDGSLINGSDHPAYIYQYDIANETLSVVIQTRETEIGAPYDPGTFPNGSPVANGDWEYGAMIDITDKIQSDATSTFLLCIQPHSWLDDAFAGADGGAIRPNERQGSQVVMITGLPR